MLNEKEKQAIKDIEKNIIEHAYIMRVNYR